MRADRNSRIAYLSGLVDGLKLGNECKTAAELDSKLQQHRNEIKRIHEQVESQKQEAKV